MSEQKDDKTTGRVTRKLDDLVDHVEQLRETNRRLNRRVQEIEGEKRYQKAWSEGYRAGSSRAYERAKKDFDKRVADYKHATRVEMAKLRDQANILLSTKLG